MNAGGSSNETVELSNFGFLYGTFPTAPGVFVYATHFGVDVDLVASAMVACTFLSAPLMFISAKMLTLRNLHPSNYIQELDSFLFKISIVSIVATVSFFSCIAFFFFLFFFFFSFFPFFSCRHGWLESFWLAESAERFLISLLYVSYCLRYTDKTFIYLKNDWMIILDFDWFMSIVYRVFRSDPLVNAWLLWQNMAVIPAVCLRVDWSFWFQVMDRITRSLLVFSPHSKFVFCSQIKTMVHSYWLGYTCYHSSRPSYHCGCRDGRCSEIWPQFSIRANASYRRPCDSHYFVYW